MSISKDEEIIRKGYKAYPEFYVPKNAHLELARLLNEGIVATGYCRVKQMELEEALRDGANFLDTYFRLHTISMIETFQVGEKWMKKIEEVSPYELPLFPMKTDDIFAGAVIENFPADVNEPICFWGINLCGTVTEQTPISWAHEITHTQLDSVIGAIGDYYNAEVLSVVVGNILASMLDSDEHMLKLNDARRVYEMLVLGEELVDTYNGKIVKSRDERLQDAQYFISDSKAYKLFLDYYYGSTEIKKEILQDISKMV